MLIVRYFFVGSVSAAVDIGLFAIFAGYFGLTWWKVSIITFGLATFINYILSVRFVFESGVRHNKRTEVAAVYAVSLFGLVVNQLALYILISFLFWNLVAAKIFATGMVFLWNYFSRKYFIF
jgi:putative flippase GtrA